MDLGSILTLVSGKNGNKEKPENFLAVKISSTSILATVWSVVDGKVTVGPIGSALIERQNDIESLILAADSAISKAVNEVDPDVSKVIFAVPYEWVIEGKISSEKLAQLRRLCKELELSPKGFVVVSEALESYFKEIEGAPLTAILLEVGKENSVLTMYRAGKCLGSVVLDQKIEDGEDGLVASMVAGFKNFSKEEVFPSRIIVFDGQLELTNIVSAISAYSWTKELHFLHFPKVEALSEEAVLRAVAVAGGMQLGGSFSVNEVEKKELPEKSDKNDSLSEFSEMTATEAGFNFDSDSDETEISLHTSPIQEEVDSGSFGTFSEFESKAVELNSEHKKEGKFKINLSFVRNLFLVKGQGKKKIISVVLILAVIVIGFFAVVYFVPKIKFIVRVTSIDFDREMSIPVVTSDSKTATDEAFLKGEFVEVMEEGTKKGVASGRKLVGDKATGTVTIYGATTGRNFPSGTVLTGPDGLKFILDRDASVASASNFLNPSTVLVTVTALGIGDKYNLAGSSVFSIGSFPTSSYLAKNDSAFSGGSSHEATVVTLSDQTRLMATLSAELIEKAISELSGKVGNDKKLLPNAVTTNITKKKFSKDVDSEADTITLDLTANYKAVVFSQDEIILLFKKNFQQDLPSDYDLKVNESGIFVLSSKVDKSGNTILSVGMKGKLVPQIDRQQIIDQVRGKNLDKATKSFTDKTGVAGLTLQVTPRMFEGMIRKFLPWRRGNYEFEIVVD